MKELFNIFAKDIQKENFSTREMIIFGIIVPAVFILITSIF